MAVLVLAVSLVILAGCGKKPEASTELAKTIQALEQPNPAAQVSAQSSPTTQASQPAQQVSQAVTALKAGDYTETIAHMEAARSNPHKTPQQMMAIQDAMAVVMTDLYDRAAKGDAVAQQAIKKYQEDRNKRR